MRNSVKKLVLMAILTAIALIIFIIEAQIPLPIPVPGIKLGLANTVTLFALFYTMKQGDRYSVSFQQNKKAEEPSPCFFSAYNVFFILLCRILLGAIFTGRPIVVIYSLAGGLLGFAAQVLMKRFVSGKQIWVCGAIAAVFHNTGQILAAMVLTGTPSIAAYLPVLVIAGIITGIITGFIAQFTLERINKLSGVQKL